MVTNKARITPLNAKGIENMIGNTSSTIWKDTQQVRTDLHNKFMGQLNTMNEAEAQKTINYYKNCIALANKEGKKLVQPIVLRLHDLRPL